MNPDSVQQQMQTVVARFGPWTAHNIELCSGVYTIGNAIAGDEIKLRRVLQLVSDIAGKSFASLRVLDLACLEGLYAIELARQEASVVAIEGREANIAKARFARDVLSLDKLDLIQDDVRNLNRERYGEFDVVLCLGIIYHLDAADLFPFIARVAEVCRGFAVIDTHVSLEPEVSREVDGKTYWGKTYTEHAPDSSPQQRAAATWSSLDNITSFWLTRPSLYNALSNVGFTSVFECHIPPEAAKPVDRITLLAMKGTRPRLLTSPLMNAQPSDDLPEHR
jgi:SAM-dependent methyltransferase